jgi:dihydropteroate synthase
MVNDVSASLWPVAAEAKVAWVAMHMRGTPATMQQLTAYDDVVAEVRSFLAERAAAAVEAGVPEVWIDPGIGFAKTAGHNLSLLRHLREFTTLGFPVLVGSSRKTFLGALTDSPPAPVEDRAEASLAAAVWAMQHGAAMVRVHDVRATVHAARLVAA